MLQQDQAEAITSDTFSPTLRRDACAGARAGRIGETAGLCNRNVKCRLNDEYCLCVTASRRVIYFGD